MFSYYSRINCAVGEELHITVEDDEIDNYQLNLKTDRPQDIDWDLNLVQKPGKEQKVTKVVEEVRMAITTLCVVKL